MSERGVFAVDRGLWDHPIFDKEPFTEREAWLWLISEAAWKPRPWRTEGQIIELQRGQLCHSVRYMADVWQWSKSRVDRYLSRLEKAQMIGTIAGQWYGTKTSVLSICNYDDFQRVAMPERDNHGTMERDNSGTTAGQNKDIKELKNNTPPLPPARGPEEPQPAAAGAGGRGPEEAAGPEPAPSAEPDPLDAEFEAFWKVYPKRDGDNPKKPARASYRRARKKGATQAEIVGGLLGMVRKAKADKRPEAGRFIPQAVTWLNQERWRDTPPEGPQVADPAQADGRYRSMVETFRKTRSWPMAWGPAPGQAGCRIPGHILAEFGYDVAA